MKKLPLPLLLLFLLMGCENESDDTDISLPNYTIEGRWLYDVGANMPSTMYEFIDGTRYTYYAASNDFSVAFWESLTVSDAIPGTNNYTFENEMLSIDLNFGNNQVFPLIFECNGGRVNFQDPDYPERYDWVRLGADRN